MHSDQNKSRLADYLEENKSYRKITDEKNFPSANEPTVKIGSENSYRCFADIKTDIEKFFQKYSFSFNSEKENEIDYYKKEIIKFREKIEKEEIIIYDSFMKLMEFIDIIRMEIKNAKIEKNWSDNIQFEFNEREGNANKKYKIINCKYHYNDILFVNKEDKNEEYQDIDILNSENNTKNFLTFLRTIKPNISLSAYHQ